MSIKLDTTDYSITIEKESFDIIFKILFDKDMEHFKTRSCSTIPTILAYHISDTLDIEYYSFLQLLTTKFYYEPALKQILKALFKEKLIFKIDLISDFYILKDAFETIENVKNKNPEEINEGL